MYYIVTCLSPEHGSLADLEYDWSEDEDPLRSWMSGEKFEFSPPAGTNDLRKAGEKAPG